MLTPLDRALEDRIAGALGRLGVRVLTSETRMRYCEQEINGGQLDGPCQPFLWLGNPEHKVFREKFHDKVLRDREWAKEDVIAAFDLLGEHCKGLCDWLKVICRGLKINLEFHDGAPVISAGAAQRWLKLTDWFDPDVLTCFLLAEQGRAHEIDKINGWGPIARIFDRDVEGHVLELGASDLHVHMGGVRTASLLWLNVIKGRLAVGRVGRYALAAIESAPADRAERDRLREERVRIEDLIEDVKSPERPLGSRWRAMPPRTVQPRNYQMAAFLRGERNMLACGFQDLLRADDKEKEKAEHRSLETALDRYIFAKSRFVHKHRQPTETNPGLAAFQDYFHSTKAVEWGAPRARRARDEASIGLRKRAQEDVALYLQQSRYLKRVELRIGPLTWPRDYYNFFRAWDAVEKEFGLREQGMDIRFAVHLKRSLTGRTKRREDETPTLRFLRDMDRDTAALHAFRTGPEWKDHAWRIARIDFAGNEREAPPDLAAYFMNLVRSEPEALACLRKHDVDPVVHRFWLHQLSLGQAKAPLNLPKLGVTCHAGEDFAQPVEGLFTIASAVQLMKLREGDSIGHGLAMGWDLERFHKAFANQRLTQRGLQFDALLWLHHDMGKRLGATDVAVRQKLEGWLLYEFNQIYGGTITIPSLNDLNHLFEERAQAVLSTRGEKRVQEIRYAEIRDHNVAKRRAERVSIAEIVLELMPAVREAQESLLRELTNKGIILEFNPSSNLRISASNLLREVPFVQMIKWLGAELCATVNSDNPGTFGTRIENEYVLLMHALLENNLSRPMVMTLLEKMRMTGMRGVFWAARPNVDDQLDGEVEDT